MTERRTLEDVIRRQVQQPQSPHHNLSNSQMSFHPNHNNQSQTNLGFNNQANDDEYGDRFYDTRPTREIAEENRNLRELISRIEEKHQGYQPERKVYRQQTSNMQRRIDHNNDRLNELREITSEQNEILSSYRVQLEEFERNLLNLMKLDKDIHSKLVNPHTSSVLEKNVRNVLVALNGKAPYDKIMKMIENIRV